MPDLSRRRLLGLLAASAAAAPLSALAGTLLPPQGALRRNPRRRSTGPPPAACCGAGIPTSAQHFAFEYYPWYRTDPWRHWDQWDRRPPLDIAATSMPLLGPYDSRDARVLERHARWIADTRCRCDQRELVGPRRLTRTGPCRC